MNLVDGVLKGNIRDIARLISVVENELPEATSAMQEIFPHTGNAYTVGFTGPPGAGKSTLVDKVTLHLCQQGKKTGIVAIDPQARFPAVPFSATASDAGCCNGKGCIIRSLSTRGSMGGCPVPQEISLKYLMLREKTLYS